MKRIIFSTVLGSIFFAGTGFAKSDAFGTLVCKKVISDEIYLKNSAGEMSVRWKNRGSEGAVKLLRALADAKIPTSLLSAYGDVVIEFAVPSENCEFSDEVEGQFSCAFEDRKNPLDLKISARVSPYGKEDYDIYEGKLIATAFKSSFYGKKDSRYVKFPMNFSVEGVKAANVKTETNFFFAHYWESEGFNQNPSCVIDGRPLVN